MVGNGWANCFRTDNELTMGLPGKYPLAPVYVSYAWYGLTSLHLQINHARVSEGPTPRALIPNGRNVGVCP